MARTALVTAKYLHSNVSKRIPKNNMKSPATVRSIVIAALAALAGGQALAVDPIFLNAMTTWGHNGDGWWAPGENGITYLLGTGDGNRSLAYNAATGNVIVTAGAAGTPLVHVLDGSTGVSQGTLNLTGVSGGTRFLNTIGVTSDGQIYGSNLAASMSTASPFKVYRWANEGAAATNVLSSGSIRASNRLGDNIDVIGSGTNAKMVFGYGSTGTGYAVLTGQTTLTAVDYPVAGTTNGDFRLGAAFYDDDTIIGTQNATTAVRISTFSGTSAVLDGSITLADLNERAIDVTMVNGRRIMATIQANSNKVRIYDLSSNPLSGVQTPLAEANLTGSFNSNGGATADLAFGAVNGDTVALYALNTNNGIQAFNVQVVPEPGTMIALGAGAAALFARRRKKA